VAIPGAAFYPAIVDSIAAGGDYSAWIRLTNDQHVVDIAIWPDQRTAAKAVERYRAGGPDTRPADTDLSNPHTLRLVQRVRNVTLAWYQRPTFQDEIALRQALVFARVKERAPTLYTSLSAIPGALIDPTTADANASLLATYSARLVLSGGCTADGCGGPDLTVALWPSPIEARSELAFYRQVGLATRYDQVNNATIVWYFDPSSRDETSVRNALH
jgi:hypothetical protein